MKCSRCGIDNSAEASFCKDCGVSLSGYTADGSTRQGMVSFSDAVKLGFQRYFEFKGRSTRAEYWWWVLVFVAAFFAVAVIDGFLGMEGILSLILYVGIVIPWLAVMVRRLHDTNKPAWWLLLNIVPFGGIVLLVFFVQASDMRTNNYGPNRGGAISQQPE